MRMQDIRRPDTPTVPRAPQKNRIEEALGKPTTIFTDETAPIPLAPKIQPSTAPTAEKESAGYSYGRFLKIFFLILAAAILLIVVGFGGYAAFKIHKTPKAETPQTVIESVGKLVALPEGETPTVATISDLTPLKDQPFFKDAQLGDKVLIYATSSKAIIYRPSQNKIINVASYDKASGH